MDHVKNKTPIAKRLAARPAGILNNSEIPLSGVTGVAIPGPETGSAPAKVAVPRSSIITKEKSYQPRSAKDKSIQVSLDNQKNLHERNTALEKEVLQLKSDLKEKESTISSCNKLMQDKHEVTVAAFKERHGSEIYSRDEKIRKLKQQISDIHQGKSWERQQQLEELRKELHTDRRGQQPKEKTEDRTSSQNGM
ncbi:uncharacterized protein LOC117402248 isoform X2 [Acipenser ruthenus]|uniref:uncharacterized protein LOC117402248 isoform X2 n=1 Tax=Acipenser ruthenus TaxID=7906 RepID=UPI0027410C31|nr:uncharacterized protein LOC117402248 isoform X2 [Acipenser ruthenus]